MLHVSGRKVSEQGVIRGKARRRPHPLPVPPVPTHRYNTLQAQAICTLCIPGKISADDRASCGDCDAGKYVFNELTCEDCPSGEYAPVALVDACLDCTAGFYTGQRAAATTCTACDGGEFSEGLAVNCESRGEEGVSGMSLRT